MELVLLGIPVQTVKTKITAHIELSTTTFLQMVMLNYFLKMKRATTIAIGRVTQTIDLIMERRCSFRSTHLKLGWSP